eukprot:TRINITY_DN14506_c0_g1_i1.p1 TRINITY_DN14506_c0_g1~~TRINITY_DN14506_c0_g1_i1.p1  ORF type:complete len:140 (-),score=27.58 TRINITY_DN14506_c0_g1_i1:19-438(-)
MMSLLDNRPQSFPSISSAIEWGLSSGTINNRESASVSFPLQLTYRDGKYYWRTDLRSTEPFWKDWFNDLSKNFLSVSAPKVLLLAGTDRLDKEMMVAQMQGKFQLAVVSSCGHQIQEDDPSKTVEIILTFLQRFKILKA